MVWREGTEDCRCEEGDYCCVTFITNIGCQFQGQRSITNNKKDKGSRGLQTARQITACWLKALAVVFTTTFFYLFFFWIIDNWHIIMCAEFHPIYLNDLTHHLQFNVWFMMRNPISNEAISSFLVTLSPIKADEYTAYHLIVYCYSLPCNVVSHSPLKHA